METEDLPSLGLSFPTFRGVRATLGGHQTRHVLRPSCQWAGLSVTFISADMLANHIPASWPDESLAGSDSEDPGPEPPLRVETKVSVELHRQEQGNHCGDRTPDATKPTATLGTQPPEQRKGTWAAGCLERLLGQWVGPVGVLWGRVGPRQVRGDHLAQLLGLQDQQAGTVAW